LESTVVGLFGGFELLVKADYGDGGKGWEPNHELMDAEEDLAISKREPETDGRRKRVRER
jgi:acetyl/propionyl-CoA carboxylase alpha subunit